MDCLMTRPSPEGPARAHVPAYLYIPVSIRTALGAVTRSTLDTLGPWS